MATLKSPLFKQRHIPRRAWLTVAVALLSAILGTGVLVMAGRGLSSPHFQLTYRGELKSSDYPLWRRVSDRIAGRRYIVLTFDDGPYGHGVDERILRTLAEHHAQAIFFEVCRHISPDTAHVLREILAGGNALGNHSFDHRKLPTLGHQALAHQIAGCSRRIDQVTGARPVFFRPPWGRTSPAVLKAIRSAGMQQVLWDANSEDTSLKTAAAIIRMSLKDLTYGGHVLLMHSKPVSADALDVLLTKLEQRGYRFVLPVPGRHRR